MPRSHQEARQPLLCPESGLDSTLWREWGGSPLGTELMTKRFLEEVPLEPGPGRTSQISLAKMVGWGGRHSGGGWGGSISNYTEAKSG